MPRVCVYEYLTAEGIGGDPASRDHGMYCEGRAMRDALAEDFAAAPGVILSESAAGADFTVVIAPETDGILGECITRLAATGTRVLSSSPEAVALTTRKDRLAAHWLAAGVPTPPAWGVSRVADVDYPCVLKPIDGAGSVHTYRVNSAVEAGAAIEAAGRDGFSTGRLMLQPFVPGRPVSVSFIVGPGWLLPLVPAFQHLSGDGRFHYCGGELPIPPELARRAVVLATRAVACVPGLLGYVGVDLLMAEAVGGDSAIEINPRMTTSYVGLRWLAGFNLAAAMLAAAAGGPLPAAIWKPGRVTFTAAGATTFQPAPAGL